MLPISLETAMRDTLSQHAHRKVRNRLNLTWSNQMKIPISRHALLAVCMAAAVPAFAESDGKGIAAEKLIGAIQVAVKAHPGLVKEVEVDTEKGRQVIKIEIIQEKGRKQKVQVEPTSQQILAR